nr:AAA family ATPase [Nonomuraea sp. FMUSA5-5]
MSGGQRRLAVALAFASRPELVFLDEPTTGLDVEARRALWAGIKVFHEDGGTVLLTSHYLEEIEALAERVLVVGQGRVLADDTMRAVRGLVGTRRVSLVTDSLPDLPGVLSAERVDGRIDLVVTDPDRLVVELVRAGVPIGILASAFFPAISMVAFVVPFAGQDPVAATMPARGAAELVWWAIAGIPANGVSMVMLAVWTVAMAAAAGWAYRRDEGR